MSKLMSQHKCDICGVTPDVIYDAPTKRGPWAWMCLTCWRANRRHQFLGTGAGQSFENKPLGKKLEG